MLNFLITESETLRAIWCKRICYIWDNEKQRFMKLVGLDKGRTCIDFHSFKGISSNEQRLRFGRPTKFLYIFEHDIFSG